jgi:hypothetical protein
MKVPPWVRIGLVVTLAVPQLVIGLWAVLAPKQFFTDFPGLDPRLVAAEPPYNAHLTTDAGAGFFATGVALVVAAVWAERRAVLLALITCAAFSLPHLLYHGAHPAAALSRSEDTLNIVLLTMPPALCALFAWAVARPQPTGSAG